MAAVVAAAPAAAGFADSLAAITTSLSQANNALSPLLASLRDDRSPSRPAAAANAGEGGLSLLGLRPNLLLEYTHLYVLLLAGALHPSSSSSSSAADLATTAAASASPSVLDDFTAPRPSRRRRSERALVEEAVLVREVMERVKGMEAKVQKQVDRLVKGAVEGGADKDLANDPMSFRPNPSALVKPSGQADDDDDDDGQPRASTSSAASAGALYRPPRLAAVPYSDLPKSGRRGAKGKEPASGSNGKTSSLLKDYALGTISSLPHQETTSGLPSLSSSARATAHKRSLAQEQDAYEEASFVRLPLKKSELKRREREERDDAFGIGGGSITGWDDVLGGLSSVGGYGAERGGGERASAWERRKRTGDESAARAAKPAKKGRFERDVGKQARRGGKK